MKSITEIQTEILKKKYRAHPDVALVDKNKLLRLVEEVEIILNSLKQDGLPVGEYPHLGRALEDVKLDVDQKPDEPK